MSLKERTKYNKRDIDKLESEKREYKKSIEKLIERNLLEEAEFMIKEYERIIKDDLDLYSIKSILFMSMGEFDKAKQVIEDGLSVDYRNFDLIYNLAHLYQITNNFIDAYDTFKKAKLYCKNEIYKTKIQSIIDEYEKYEDIIVYNKNRLEKKYTLPKATIIIPTYNQKENLEEAIDSCLCQDYPNLRILIGDDCSNDGTDEMMKKYNDYDQVIYVKNSKNLGANDNCSNLLYNHTKSKYGMILNHDDYLVKENYITETINLFVENPNLSFIWANCNNKNEISGENWNTDYKLDKIIKGIDYFLNYETFKYPHITGMLTSVFDFDKLKKVGKWGINKNENSTFLDTILYLKLMLIGDVGFIDECIGVYRIHDKSISNNFPKEYDEIIIKEFELIKKYIVDNSIVNIEQGEAWVNKNIFSYIGWRFSTLWMNNSKKDAMNLLIFMYNKYPIVYDRIVENI